MRPWRRRIAARGAGL